MTDLGTIRPLSDADIGAITDIYNHYIRHSTATFETEPVTADEMCRRLSDIAASFPCLVCEVDGEVAGYCYTHLWQVRAAYRHTLEVAVYLSPHHTGKDMGFRLMRRLIGECRALNCHALIACVTAENEASCALHRKLGFRQVARYAEVGRKFGRWLDVVDFELLL